MIQARIAPPCYTCLLIRGHSGCPIKRSRCVSVANDGLISEIAAIASGIALTESPDRTNDIADVVERAVRYVEAGIQTSFDLGRGNGPINHFHSLSTRPLSPFPSTLERRVYGKAQDEGRLAQSS